MSAASVTSQDGGSGPARAVGIVCETDLEGRITFVTEGFLRASGFAEAELLGRPHGVLRHPDMPLSIFAQQWEKTRRGEELFLYVQNLAKDGRGYWELAHVAPLFDDRGALAGCRSVRRPADAEEVAQIAPFYRKIRKLEADAEAMAGRSRSGHGAVAA